MKPGGIKATGDRCSEVVILTQTNIMTLKKRSQPNSARNHLPPPYQISRETVSDLKGVSHSPFTATRNGDWYVQQKRDSKAHLKR